jgi:hypothetical protein
MVPRFMIPWTREIGQGPQVSSWFSLQGSGSDLMSGVLAQKRPPWQHLEIRYNSLGDRLTRVPLRCSERQTRATASVVH